MRRTFWFALLLLCIAPAIAAQPGSCPALVDDLLAQLDSICADVGRNEICYGNTQLEAVPFADVENFTFETVGDIEGVSRLQTLDLSPLDEETSEWGVVLMRLQADLPDTIPGQNVTFIAFGDVELTNAVTDLEAANPMQAFYLSTGIGAVDCEDVPTDGLLVQTPEGAGQVTFSVNGVDVSIGSTAYLQAQPEGVMQISLLEGTGATRSGDEITPLVAGTNLTYMLDDTFRPRSDTPFITGYDADRFERLPIRHLPRPDIAVVPPLGRGDILTIRNQVRQGGNLCGVGPLPDCENAPFLLGGERCALGEDGELTRCEPPPRWGEAGFGDRPPRELRDGPIQPLRPPGDDTPFNPPRLPRLGDDVSIPTLPPPPPDSEGTHLPPLPDGDDIHLPPPPDGDDIYLPPPPDDPLPPPPRPPGG